MYQEELVSFEKDQPMMTLVEDGTMQSAGSGELTEAGSGNEWQSGLIHLQHQTQLRDSPINWKDPRDFYHRC